MPIQFLFTLLEHEFKAVLVLRSISSLFMAVLCLCNLLMYYCAYFNCCISMPIAIYCSISSGLCFPSFNCRFMFIQFLFTVLEPKYILVLVRRNIFNLSPSLHLRYNAWLFHFFVCYYLQRLQNIFTAPKSRLIVMSRPYFSPSRLHHFGQSYWLLPERLQNSSREQECDLHGLYFTRLPGELHP